MTTRPPPPSRRVIQADALAWLDANPAEPGTSVITSLPDLSELRALGFDGWRKWFVEAARQVIRWVPNDGVAIFFQSDICHDGAWVDKGYLVARAAEDEGARLGWHKIVCREPPGSVSYGRATYSHLICVSRAARAAPRHPSPDVLPSAGAMPYSKAMGVEACRFACEHAIAEAGARRVVDPFCGRGTVLAVANALGLESVGVDIAARKCRAARKLEVELAPSQPGIPPRKNLAPTT